MLPYKNPRVLDQILYLNLSAVAFLLIPVHACLRTLWHSPKIVNEWSHKNPFTWAKVAHFLIFMKSFSMPTLHLRGICVCTEGLQREAFWVELVIKENLGFFGEHSGNQLGNPRLSQRAGKYRCKAAHKRALLVCLQPDLHWCHIRWSYIKKTSHHCRPRRPWKSLCKRKDYVGFPPSRQVDSMQV